MIPRRISLKGFLCYRDEQIIDFDAADLWVFTGRNGSGKSAVFDGMTYAFFNAHRGGKQNAASLIHTASDGLCVIFDFDLGGVTYQIRRSLTRGGRAERQLFRHDDENDDWRAVPETDSDKGLKEWVRRNLGLTFETFTASVLLMQGQAEKLLSPQNAERFEMLAGVIDLERFLRLHKAAEARKGLLKGRAKLLRIQASLATEVDPAAVENAVEATVQTARDRDAEFAERNHLHELLGHSREWAFLTEQRDEATRKRDLAMTLLSDSKAIQGALERLRELGAILPKLESAFDLRRRLDRSLEDARRFENEQKVAERRLDLVAALAEDARKADADLSEEVGSDENRRRQILERKSVLAGPIARVRLAQDQLEAIAELETELASYRVDLSVVVGRLEGDLQHLTGWKTASPALKRLARDRGGLAEAKDRQASAKVAIGLVEADLGRLTQDVASRRDACESLRVVERSARDEATRTVTLAGEAEARLREFEDLEGTSSCKRCGQPLTEGHYAEELARRRAEATEARRIAEDSKALHEEAQSNRIGFESDLAGVERLVEETGLASSRWRQSADEAGRDILARHEACSTAYEELDTPFRVLVSDVIPADWPATTFPTNQDLEEADRLVAGLPVVTDRLSDARRLRTEREGILARLDQARRSLEGLNVDPSKESALIAEHDSLTAEVGVIDRCLAAHERERALLGEALDGLSATAKELEGRRSDADRNGSAERARCEEQEAELDRIRSAISEPWKLAVDLATADDLDRWKNEQRAIREGDVEAKAAGLLGARSDLDGASSRLDDADLRIAALPVESHRPPTELEVLSRAADARLMNAEETLRGRRAEEGRLRRELDDRLDKEARALEAERESSVADTLAQLLGRECLQRHLLRAAERGIVAHANPILREVSGGELELRLLDDGADLEQVLLLKALVRTHGRTREHEIPYLSGSQKFRVAVSLAFGIGKYARGQLRPIGSVIIDEGFGCLDRQGRKEMIDQLNELRGRLDRIILVSHQEEIADAFADGYRFEIIDGSTVVEPFHR